MKRILLIIFLLLAPSICLGQGGGGSLLASGKAAACTCVEGYGGTCTTSGFDANLSWFQNANRKYGGFQFTVGGSGYTLTKMSITVEYVGDVGTDTTPESSVTAYLCDDSSDEPACNDADCASAVSAGTCTQGNTVAVSSFPTGSADYQEFTFSGGKALSASTDYWLVLVNSDPASDENVEIYFDNSGTPANDLERDSDATSWSEDRNDKQTTLRGYKGGC